MSTSERSSTRERVLDVAMTVLVRGGRDAVSTRVVCQGAGIQAPTLYREFGDKQGLLDAVAERGFAAYLDAAEAPTGDPIEDLRHGWDVQVGFGLAHPYLYSLTYGDARPGAPTPAAGVAHRAMATLVHRVARAGLLAVSQKQAMELLAASVCGVTLTLITGTDLGANADLRLSTEVRERLIDQITTDDRGPNASPGPAEAAIHLQALLGEVHALSAHEVALLGEWLARIADRGTLSEVALAHRKPQEHSE